MVRRQTPFFCLRVLLWYENVTLWLKALNIWISTSQCYCTAYKDSFGLLTSCSILFCTSFIICGTFGTKKTKNLWRINCSNLHHQDFLITATTLLISHLLHKHRASHHNRLVRWDPYLAKDIFYLLFKVRLICCVLKIIPQNSYFSLLENIHAFLLTKSTFISKLSIIRFFFCFCDIISII